MARGPLKKLTELNFHQKLPCDGRHCSVAVEWFTLYAKQYYCSFHDTGIDSPKLNFAEVLFRSVYLCNKCQEIKKVLPEKLGQRSRSCDMTLNWATSRKVIRYYIVGKGIVSSIQ
jgi:hypothetical protein